MRQEHISLWMLCIYFFFEYVRPQSLYPVLDILPWGQLFLMLAVISAMLDKSVHWVKSTQNKYFILFLFTVILSGIFAFKPSVSWEYRNVMFGWFLVYFLTITVVNTERRLILFLLAYMLFNLKMGQHGAITWAQRGFSFASFGLIGSPGWFRNSGEYAIQMLIFGSLAISFFISLKNYWGRYKKIIMFACAATGYMAVMGASSRGAQIALAAIGIWMFLKQRGGLKGFIGIIVLSIVLFQFLPEEQISRFSDMGNDKTSLQRLAYWEYGLEVFKSNLLIGIGYHNWITYLQVMVPEGLGPSAMIQEPHNIYVQAASELGIFGLVFLFLLIINAFFINSQTRKIAKYKNNTLFYNLTYGFDAGLIGFLVAGSFVTVLYYPFFWIQIGMIVALNLVSRNNNNKGSKPIIHDTAVDESKYMIRQIKK